jgi:hypothetical protein
MPARFVFEDVERFAAYPQDAQAGTLFDDLDVKDTSEQRA